MSGRVDIIIKTVQLVIDKYIIKEEANGELPSRALVSLDIRNMINAVSRERLHEIIAEHFLKLEPFADLIYDFKGQIFVRLGCKFWRNSGRYFDSVPDSGFFGAEMLQLRFCRSASF